MLHVAGGEDSLVSELQCHGIKGDISHKLRQLAVPFLPHGHNDAVSLYAADLVGLKVRVVQTLRRQQFQIMTARQRQFPVFALHFHGCPGKSKFDALLPGLGNIFSIGSECINGAAINDGNAFRALTHGRLRAVESHISAANHHDMAGQLLTAPCTDFHKKSECRQHARQFFSFNRRLASASRSQSEYYGIITLR